MENVRNKQFILFKLFTLLSSMMKSRTTLLLPAQNVNQPSIWRCVRSLVALSGVPSIVMVWQCLCSSHPSFT